MTSTIAARAHNGGANYGNASSKQTAKKAMRLSNAVVDTIRDIANKEEPEMHFCDERLNKVGARSIEFIISSWYCRPNEKFLQKVFSEIFFWVSSMRIKIGGDDVQINR